MNSKPRICLVLDDYERRTYHHKEIRSLLDHGYEIPLILIDETFVPQQDIDIEGSLPMKLWNFLKWILSRKFSALIYAERELAELVDSKTLVKHDIFKLKKRDDIRRIDGIENSDFVHFSPIKSGHYTYTFPEDVVNQITNKSEVVVLLGFNKILRGGILHAPEYGVLSFHGSDIRRYRGRPPGFFQYINREKEVGLSLQQLTKELDGGKLVLCVHADIRDVRSWHEVQLRIYEMYGSLLVQGIEKLEREDFTPEKPSELGYMTYEKEGDNISNVIKCILLNIYNRYIK